LLSLLVVATTGGVRLVLCMKNSAQDNEASA
jgi:hypothetical protein